MKCIHYIFLIATTISYGQTGFIEVEVRDSIQLIPLKFEYNVQVNESSFIKYDKDGRYDTKTEEIKSLLTSKGYVFRPLKKSSFEIESNPILAYKGYIVTVKNIDQLKKLTADLEKLEGISGVIPN